MATVALTEENFESIVNEDSFVLIDFWAAWCGPCKMFAPVFEEASEKYPEITFAKVDTEAQPGLAGAFGIQSIPTLTVLRERIVLHSQAGALPAAALDQLIQAAKALDMEEVRAQVQERSESAAGS